MPLIFSVVWFEITETHHLTEQNCRNIFGINLFVAGFDVLTAVAIK
jgi:hypothetical protein